MFLPSLAMCQWRAVAVSEGDTKAIQENFRRASLWSNRKLDRFSNDTLYGQPIFENGIKFSDGSVQNTAAITGLGLSSSTIMPAWSTAQSSFTACATGSTVTITTAGSTRVIVAFAGAVETSSISLHGASYLLDGVAANSGKAVTAAYGLNNIDNLSFTTMTDIIAAGSHTFCFSLAATSGLTSLYLTNSSTNIFWVKEVN